MFATFGDPDVDSGYLVILDNSGNELFDILLPSTGYNGNGNGAPAAPTSKRFEEIWINWM